MTLRSATRFEPWLTRSQKFVHDLMVGCSQLTGWQRLVVAFALGMITALALAPFRILPGLVIGLSGLVLLLDSTTTARAPKRAAFFVGWMFGFGYFLFGCYWLAFSFLVQADQFAWMIPIAVPGFTAFLGLFVGLPALVAAFFWRPGLGRIALFVALLSVFEGLRGTILTGFPWNLFGQAFAGSAWLAQPAAWVGPYGLSLLVILIAALPAGMLTPHGLRLRPLLISVGALAVLLTASGLRLILGPVSYVDDISVVIVQPNVPQRDKLDPTRQDINFERMIAMSQEATPETGRSYVVWPENAYPFLANSPHAPAFFADTLPPEAVLMVGTLRTYDDQGTTRYGNSAAVFGATVEGEKPLAAIYDKHHLVPFGEYLPLNDLLRALGLAQLAPVGDGFTPGPGPTTFDIGGAPFSLLICYEDVFPRALYPADQRPEWLVTVTNDAWFGDNAGPMQHLDISRLRSIESGLPMARSANTGISAMIGPRGRLLESIPLYTSEARAVALPQPIGRPIYDTLGPIPHFALILGLFSIVARGALARRG